MIKCWLPHRNTEVQKIFGNNIDLANFYYQVKIKADNKKQKLAQRLMQKYRNTENIRK